LELNQIWKWRPKLS